MRLLLTENTGKRATFREFAGIRAARKAKNTGKRRHFADFAGTRDPAEATVARRATIPNATLFGKEVKRPSERFVGFRHIAWYNNSVVRISAWRAMICWFEIAREALCSMKIRCFF